VIDLVDNVDIGLFLAIAFTLILGAAWIGLRLGTAQPRSEAGAGDVGTLAGAALGILGLLLGFSFSIAVARYDERREVVLEEANAIGSAGNFALMLPKDAQGPVLTLLREYTAVRIGLGTPRDGERFAADVARSVALQDALWRAAIAVNNAAPPDSLSVHRFIGALNEMNNAQERRLLVLRAHVPFTMVIMLICTGMFSMGFTGYYAGLNSTRRTRTVMFMAVLLVLLIGMVIDLDEPTRGLVRVSVQSLIDAQDGLPK
jgi:hypothetical protein